MLDRATLSDPPQQSPTLREIDSIGKATRYIRRAHGLVTPPPKRPVHFPARHATLRASGTHLLGYKVIDFVPHANDTHVTLNRTSIRRSHNRGHGTLPQCAPYRYDCTLLTFFNDLGRLLWYWSCDIPRSRPPRSDYLHRGFKQDASRGAKRTRAHSPGSGMRHHIAYRL